MCRLCGPFKAICQNFDFHWEGKETQHKFGTEEYDTLTCLVWQFCGELTVGAGGPQRDQTESPIVIQE